MPPNEPQLTRRQLLRATAYGGAAWIGADSIFGAPNNLEIQRITAPIRGLVDSFQGWKVALISDFHLGNYIDPVYVRSVVQRANALEPDIMLLGGDFLHSNVDVHAEIEFCFSECAAKHGVFAVLGNHDHLSRPDLTARHLESKTPVQMIENRNIIFRHADGELALAGCGDMKFGVVDYKLALQGIDAETPRLMLEHNPDLAEEMDPACRVDLQLSGHTHGGQVAMPWMNWAPVVPSKYGSKFLKGLAQGRSHRVVVSKGIGGGGPYRPRFSARPDITLVTLVKG